MRNLQVVQLRKIALVLLVVGIFFTMTDAVLAEEVLKLAESNRGNNYGLDDVANRAGLSVEGANTSFSGVIGTFIQPLIGLIGTLFMVLIIYGGVLWMTAGGNEEQVTKAKKTVSSAVVGLVAVLMAYGISLLVAVWLLGSEQISGVCITSDPTTQCNYVDFQSCPIEDGAIFDAGYLSCDEACVPPDGSCNEGVCYFCS